MTSADSVIRFGGFEADLRSGELRRDGAKIKLGAQPFSVLALLLATPGQPVTREELQKQLWPADTFVDFERGLNKAINRLREALVDSADSPRFIETLPKRGYRFIGAVEMPPSSPVPEDVPVNSIAPPPVERPVITRRLAAAAGATVLVAIATVVWWSVSNGPAKVSADPFIRSSLLPPPHTSFVPYSAALSADGTHLAFVAEAADGSRALWIRAMSAPGAIVIAGTDGASFPFWSPDQRHVGFFADRKLKVLDVGGGAIRVIADARRPSGGTWNADDVIVFAPDVNGPLYRVAAGGGTPTIVSQPPDGKDVRGHRWPVFLPDGRRFLYVALTAGATDDAPELRVGSLDTVESTRVPWEGARSVAYALEHLLYVRGGTLYAQPFDPAKGSVSGRPVPVTGPDIAGPPVFYRSELAVSPNGVLVVQSSVDAPSQLVWLDAHGRESAALSAVSYAGPAISPDGRQLTGSCEGPRVGTSAICVYDIERSVGTRITDGPNDRYPTWSPDGREIAYSAGPGIYRVRADGTGSRQFVSGRGTPTDRLPDGRVLSFGSLHGEVSLALSSVATHEVTELGPGAEGQLSPDGAWLAFIGRDGLVVQRFPKPTDRITVTGYGAAQPRWSRDGRHIFYIGADKELMAAEFDPVNVTARVPVALAHTRIIGASLSGFQYDVAPDGRFILSAGAGDAAPLTLISGWTSRLTTDPRRER